MSTGVALGVAMHIDPALLSAVSALVGALIGGGASLSAAVYTQRYQDRVQRLSREVTKRETVYAAFIMEAAKSLLNAYVNEGLTLNGDEKSLLGLTNRMRLFAPPNIMEHAERVINGIVEIALQPSVDLRKFAAAKLQEGQSDPLLPFSVACRSDLDQINRRVV
jgi:hypothetical protein